MRRIPSGQSAIGRRHFLANCAGALAAGSVGTLALSAGSVARAHELGILDRAAPELKVDYWLDAGGNPSSYSIEAYRGRWIFLECFQYTCVACHKYGFPTLKKVADAFEGDQRVSVAAVQTVFEGFESNTRTAVREVQLLYELPIPMGHDPGSADGERLPSTMLSYRTGGTPWIIVIEPGGTVAYNDFRIDDDRFIELLKEELG